MCFYFSIRFQAVIFRILLASLTLTLAILLEVGLSSLHNFNTLNQTRFYIWFLEKLIFFFKVFHLAVFNQFISSVIVNTTIPIVSYLTINRYFFFGEFETVFTATLVATKPSRTMVDFFFRFSFSIRRLRIGTTSFFVALFAEMVDSKIW